MAVIKTRPWRVSAWGQRPDNNASRVKTKKKENHNHNITEALLTNKIPVRFPQKELVHATLQLVGWLSLDTTTFKKQKPDKWPQQDKEGDDDHVEATFTFRSFCNPV